MKTFLKKHMYLLRDIIFVRIFITEYGKYIIRRIFLFIHTKSNKLHYPITLQLPITNKCNLDCAMCNIHANNSIDEFSLDEFQDILKDPIFRKIKYVGINGGEPYILKNIDEYIKIIISTLPKIKSVYIISNGTIKDTLEKLKYIKDICSEKNIKVIQSFSIDGYKDMHDIIRGKKGTFEKLSCTIEKIKDNKDLYCDELNFICTLTKKNIYRVKELEAYAESMDLSINYNIATDHKRLSNSIKYNEYSIFTDSKALFMAREFLYEKFKLTGKKNYYALYRYLADENHVRVGSCAYLHDAITLTANGDICYCATHSKVLMNARYTHKSIEEVYFENKDYNNEIAQTYCQNCSHYMGSLNNQAYKDYIREKLELYKKP